MNRALLVLGIASLLGAGCDRAEKRTPKTVLRLNGAGLMIQLATAWAEGYAKTPGAVPIEGQGARSGTGIAALLNGKVDLATSVRKLNEGEGKQFLAAFGKQPKGTVVGYEALAVAVHHDNPIASMSLEELWEIYAEKGRIINWGQLVETELGPIPSAISVGDLHSFFKTQVLRETTEFRHSSVFNGESEKVNYCAENRAGICFVRRFGYVRDERVKWLKVV